MNSVNVIGRLTKSNEPKQYNSQNGGGLMLKNTIAIKGKKKDESYFIDFTAWGKTAEYLAQYSNKGDKIAISGELVQESWQDNQSGQNRSKISINAVNVEILSTSQNNQAQFNQQSQYNQQAPKTYGNYDTMPAEVHQAVNRHNASYNQAPQGVISEDEIPF